MSKPDTPEIQHCSDGGCIFGHPGGMHTNGGCACLKEIRSSSRGFKVQQNIRALRHEIQNLRDIREMILHALDQIRVCADTKMCPGCVKLAESVLKDPATSTPEKD